METTRQPCLSFLKCCPPLFFIYLETQHVDKSGWQGSPRNPPWHTYHLRAEIRSTCYQDQLLYWLLSWLAFNLTQWLMTNVICTLHAAKKIWKKQSMSWNVIATLKVCPAKVGAVRDNFNKTVSCPILLLPQTPGTFCLTELGTIILSTVSTWCADRLFSEQ